MEMLNSDGSSEFQRIRLTLGHGSGVDPPGFVRAPEVTQRLATASDRWLPSVAGSAGLDPAPALRLFLPRRPELRSVGCVRWHHEEHGRHH
jgi:hypothetical protein